MRTHHRPGLRARALPALTGRQRLVSLAVLGGLAAGMLGVSGLVPSALATSNAWADENAGSYVDSDLAEIDDASHPNRCEGIPGIPFGTDPGWVRTSGSPSPYAPVTETLGQVLDPRDYLNPNMNIDGHEGNGMSNPFVAIGDNTFNHYARDLNVFLTPDFVYRNQMATGNFKNGYNSQEFANFEVEWERGAVPNWAMPARGDRLRVYGPLIFDCGHGNEGPYGQDDEYRTEIHPPVGWVVYRQTADADGVPQNNKQSLAWKWYEPTDLQGMATTLPSTDLHDTLVWATVADTFFSSFGGNVIESLNGCDDNGDLEVGTGAAAPCYVSARFHNDAALDTYEWGSDVLNQDYNFTVPAPPRPVGAPAHSDLLYEIEEMCGSVPSDPTFPDKGLAEWEDGPESAYHDDRGIGTATCNPNSPYEVSVDRVGDAYWNETGQPAIRFRLRAKTGADGTDGTVDDPVYPANDYLAFAYRIKVAWDWVPATAADFRTTRVDFDTLNVWHNGEDSTDGEWLMELRANETRTYPVRGDAGFDDNDGDKVNEPFYEDGAVSDDTPGVDTYEIGSPGQTAVTHRVDLLPGEQVRIWEKTLEWDEPDADDFLHVNQTALTPPTGHQTTTHEVGLFNVLWWGNHTISVKLTDETIKPPDKATLEFYGGWKDPITGRWRVRATDPVRVWSDTNDVRYRIWKEGDTPGPWINVWDFPDPFGAFVLRPGNPIHDGLYNIEWAAMREDPGTGKVHVSPYQWTQFELDNTKPTLNLPPNLIVEATETGGAVVDYAGQVSAADNFDPQPTLDHGTNPTIECVPPSGSLFPNGQNAPKTTSVACQARDAVGNTTTGTFTVTVNSPFGYLDDFVILGWQWAEIGGQSHVFSGNVGAYDSSDGVAHAPLGYPNIELATGKDTVVEPHSKLAAESIWLEAGTQAGGVWWVDEFNTGAGATYTSHPGYVPLWPCPAKFPVFSASGPELTFSSDTSMVPGTYGHLIVMPGVALRVPGGDYYVESITLMHDARLEVERPARFHVDETVVVDDNGYIGPRPGYPIQAHDIEMYATGVPGATTPAFAAANDVVLTLNVQTRDGLLEVGHRATATGAFLGPMVQFGRESQLYLDSAFVLDCDPTLYPQWPELGEICIHLTGHDDCSEPTLDELCLEHAGMVPCTLPGGTDHGWDPAAARRCVEATGDPGCETDETTPGREPPAVPVEQDPEQPRTAPGEWEDGNPNPPPPDDSATTPPPPTTTTTIDGRRQPDPDTMSTQDTR